MVVAYRYMYVENNYSVFDLFVIECSSIVFEFLLLIYCLELLFYFAFILMQTLICILAEVDKSVNIQEKKENVN